MIFFLLPAISILFFARTVKAVLFWIYLWQLKEYHIGRFVDHFRTYKGKKIFFNALYGVKFIVLALLLANIFFAPLLYAVLLMYMVECLVFALHIARRKFLKPVATAKTIFLTAVSLGIIALYTLAMFVFTKTPHTFAIAILLFDILTPLFVSLIVLLAQPFFVMARYSILKKAAAKMRQHKNVTVIGITGSYGKTSTKEFLTTILSAKFRVLATKEHQNSEIGIARCILDNLTQEHQVFVVEMGSYAKGGIKLLCDIVKPSIGIVTGVNQQHLALFGSMENLLSAEGGRELVQSLPKDGLIVLNGDNKYCIDLYKKTALRKKIYTMNRDKIDCDIWTEDITIEKNAISFLAESREKEMANIRVNVLGRQNVQNILGAMLIAKELGMSFEEIAYACNAIRQHHAGISLHINASGVSIIDASYSSNPDGVIADLDYLDVFTGKKIIVMPCLIELGETSAQIHQEIGKKIAKVCDLAIITTQDKFEEIKMGAVLGGMAVDSTLLCDNPEEIFAMINRFCSQGDAVLLEGRVPHALIKKLIKNAKAQ